MACFIELKDDFVTRPVEGNAHSTVMMLTKPTAGMTTRRGAVSATGVFSSFQLVDKRITFPRERSKSQ